MSNPGRKTFWGIWGPAIFLSGTLLAEAAEIEGVTFRDRVQAGATPF